VLSKEEKNPGWMINKFCNMFTLSYARQELWDLLDSVIFYEKNDREWGPDPLTTYRCLSALVEAAFMVYQIFL
jgi:hypothetical protein